MRGPTKWPIIIIIIINFLVSMTVCSPLQQIVVNRNRTHKPQGAAFPSVTISIKGPYPNVKGN